MREVAKVIEACGRMGVPFHVVDVLPKKVIPGPASGGCHPITGVYMLSRDGFGGEAWTWALHELAHVVWWHPVDGVKVNEAPLIVWEYAVCKYLGIRGYFDAVYTRDTLVAGKSNYCAIEDFSRPTQAKWYKQARAECVARGALTPEGKPTWRKPT